MSDISTLVAPVQVDLKVEARFTKDSPYQVKDKDSFNVVPGVYRSHTYSVKTGDLGRLTFAVGRRAWMPEVDKQGRAQEYRFGPKDSPVTVSYQRVSDTTVKISVGR